MIKSCSCTQILETSDKNGQIYRSPSQQAQEKIPKLQKKYSLKKLKQLSANNENTTQHRFYPNQTIKTRSKPIPCKKYLQDMPIFCIPQENETINSNPLQLPTKPVNFCQQSTKRQQNKQKIQTGTQEQILDKKFFHSASIKNCVNLEKNGNLKNCNTQNKQKNSLLHNFNVSDDGSILQNKNFDDKMNYRRIQKLLTTSQALQNRYRRPIVPYQQRQKKAKLQTQNQPLKTIKNIVLIPKFRKNQN